MKGLVVAITLLFAITACAEPRVRPTEWAQPILGVQLGNFYQVSKDLYRSDQPGDEAMRQLQAMGIRSALNLREFHSDNEEAENTARTEKIRDSVLQLHDSGRGAHLSRGTLWGAFNSVTEYTDHMMFGEDPMTRLKSIWFGSGEQLKLKAFHLAERMMRA